VVKTKLVDHSIDEAFEARFQAALNRKAFKKPLPEYFGGNRSEPIKVVREDELCAGTTEFFEDVHNQLELYSTLGHDVMWFEGWLKKYWVAWIGGIDEALVHELIAPDCEYFDPLSFGRPMYGVQGFIDYNQGFFDATPDLRYDAIPGQAAIQVSPTGELTFMAKYYGTGHWEKPLRMYPFRKGAVEIPATGCFMQGTATDRYHFDANHQLCRGETLWDPLGFMQMIGLVPNDQTPAFRMLMRAGTLKSKAGKLPVVGSLFRPSLLP
jgi:hypothetical protein